MNVELVALVGQPKPPTTFTGTDALVKARVDGAPLVQVPFTVAAEVGAAVTVQDARPLVLSTNPPTGMVSPAVTGAPFCMATPQVPVVVTVALTPGMLVVQEP